MNLRRTRRGAVAVALATAMSGTAAVSTTAPSAAAPIKPRIGVGPAGAALAVNGQSQWGPVENWPLIAIHAALDSQGRVVTYGTNGDGQQTGRFIYDIWTPGPSAAGGHATLANTTQTDLFCSLQINRSDTGEMLLFGGDNWTGVVTNNLGNPDINSYNPTTGQLTSLPGMNRSRWYGTGTALPDGSIYIQGGDGGYDRPELWTPEGGAQLLDLDTSGLSWWYPRNFVLPDGRIFGVDVQGRMYYISADLGSITMAGRLSSDRWGYGASAVMYEPGKILHFGGVSETAIIIDVNGPNPIITPTDSMSSGREWVNGTLLPDGRVLATGGAANYTAVDGSTNIADYGVNNAAEIWDPATGQWTVEGSGVEPRLYHSTALLLPDGRVLVAGGGAPGPVANTNAEIFSPDYLMTTGGAPMPRPTINSVSSTNLVPGSPLSLDVTSAAGVARVTLVKSGSVTHSFNMDQRFLELPVIQNGATVQTTIPASGFEVTPGYYLLSVVDSAGVPSQSRLIRIAPSVDGPVTVDEAQIVRLYRAYFLRDPDPAGLDYWKGQMAAGVALATISDAFAGSAEFVNTYGNLTDPQFVDQIYLNVLGRPAEPEGRAYWIGQLAAGVTRGQVMLAFSESPEFINLTNTTPPPGPPPPPEPEPAPAPWTPPVVEAYRAEVHRLYLAYFLRTPDDGGLSYWTNQRAIGVSLIIVSDAFAASAEFQATYGSTTDEQFVDLVYLNVLGREAEPEGRAYWIGQLAAGVTRGEVMIGFSESAEFIAKVGPIG